MALFARKLVYGACDGEVCHTFFALVEISKKKGGCPLCYVLYWYSVFSQEIKTKTLSQAEIKMIRLQDVKSKEEAMEYSPFFKKGTKFPGWDSDLWQKTSPWLYGVAVGGSYEQHSPGNWVRVPTPNSWAKRRKKRLQSLSTAHMLVVLNFRLKQLEIEETLLTEELSYLSEWDEESNSEFIPEDSLGGYMGWKERKNSLDREIEDVKVRILCVKDELRFKYAREAGVLYWRRNSNGIITCPT